MASSGMTQPDWRIEWDDLLRKVAVEAVVSPRDLYSLVQVVEATREFFDSLWGAWVDWDEMRLEDRHTLEALVDDVSRALGRFRFGEET